MGHVCTVRVHTGLEREIKQMHAVRCNMRVCRDSQKFEKVNGFLF